MHSTGSKSTNATSVSVSSSNISRVLDDKSLLAATVAGNPENKTKDYNYVLDAEGNPTGTLIDTLLFSDLLKKTVTKTKKNEEIRFNSKYHQPFSKHTSKMDECKKPGRIPVASSLFHLTSNRERKDATDDGLEDEDLTAADGIPRRPKTRSTAHERRDSQKRAMVYQNIKITKGEFSFPHRTYRPKVQIAHRVPLGQVPQAVAVERLHRYYKRTDINMVLQSLGVELDDLIPVPNYGETNERFYQEMMFRNRVLINGVEKREYILHFNQMSSEVFRRATFKIPTRLHHPQSNDSLSYPSTSSKHSSSATDQVDDDDGKGEEHQPSIIHPFIKTKPPFGPMFPLDLFDNESFDIRPGEQWIELGYDTKTGTYPIPGKAFLPHSTTTQGAVVQFTPTYAEQTCERIFKQSETLEAFRTLLMNARYKRQIGYDGEDMATMPKLSHQELLAIARSVSTVQSFLPVMMMNMPYLESLHADAIRVSSNSSLEMSHSILSFTNIQESGAKEDAMNTDDDIEKIAGVNTNLNFLTKELMGGHYFAPVTDSDTTDTDATPTTEMGIFKLAKNAVRSESLLSEVFSDLSTTALIASEIDAVGSIHMTEVSDVEEEESIQGRTRRKQTQKQKKKKSEDQEGDYGYTFPTSPDIDEYEDGFDDVVFDFDKMKKTHTYDWRWVDVAVFVYNEVTRKYLVRSIHPPYIFAWVGKVYLCFDGEDPTNHCNRIKDAIMRRFEMENTMRYNLYLDALPVDDQPTIPRPQMKGIMAKAMGLSKINEVGIPDKLKHLVKSEMDFVYKRTLAQEKFENVVERHPKIYKYWLKIPEKEMFFERSKQWEQFNTRLLGSKHFVYKANVIQKLSVIYTKEPYTALRKVVGFCQDARSKAFILTNLDPVSIEEYARIQKENMEIIVQYLKNEWFNSILSSIREELGKIPNSWFDMRELKWDIFMLSKLSKYLRLVHFVMSDTVRFLVIDSLKVLVGEMKGFTKNCEGIDEFDWGNDLSKSEYPPPPGRRPILQLQLHMTKNGPTYTYFLYRHHQILAELFSYIIHAAYDIPELLPLIMPQFLFGDPGVLVSISEDEHEIWKLKQELIHYTKLALKPVDIYAQKFSRYQSAVDIDVPTFLRDWSEESHTASEVRRAIEQLRGQINKFEEEIPDSIEITAFNVIVGVVRQRLVRNKSTLVTALLDHFALKLRATVANVKEEYAEMEKKLTTRSGDIEEVHELKLYLEMVPTTITRMDDTMQRTLKDYELFEKFGYTVTNDDSDSKWAVAIHSIKAMRMAGDAIGWLDEDTDRLLKVHQADLAQMSDQIDSATLSVGGLGAFVELEKAADAAAEVRKVSNIVDDLKERNEMLNKRQKLFGMPPIQNKTLETLVEDIEPFKYLWFTAADWIRIKESVFRDVLDKIDVVALTNVINEGSEIIEACIEYFEEADTIQHIAKEVLFQLNDFKPLVPLIQTLKNHGMRQRHWEMISNEVGFPVVSRGGESFKKLLEKGLADHIDFIKMVGEIATDENFIEVTLDLMEKNITNYSISVTQDEETEVSILTVSNETKDIMEKYLETTAELEVSPHKDTFEERLTSWTKKIKLLESNLDDWMQCQNSWLELQPTFKAPDIGKRMPQEFKLFQTMDWVWRRLIRRAKATTELQELATDLSIVSGIHTFHSLQQRMNELLEERKNIQAKNSDSDD